MRFFPVFWVLAVLVFGSQVVLSANFTFHFDPVHQCEPVSINFTHTGAIPPGSLPLTLTILPFNSIPIVIPIPNVASNTTGVYVTFLPLPANTSFIASLDNAAGHSVAPVSNVIEVLDSPTGNHTCLSNTPELFYSFDDTISQCEPFNVTFNSSEITRTPSVRAFIPQGPAFRLKQVANDTDGVASYQVAFMRGFNVLLLLDDGSNHQQTSPLITVAGDSSSPVCFSTGNNHAVGPSGQPGSKSKPSNKVSKAAIIGLSVGGGLVVIISAVMIWFALRERCRRRVKDVTFDPTLLRRKWTDEKRDFSPSPSSLTPPASLNLPASFTQPSSSIRFGPPSFVAPNPKGFVKDPPYTQDNFSEKFGSPSSSYYPRTSISSWLQAVPEDQGYPRSERRSSARSAITLDIEGMLDMAAISENHSNTPMPSPSASGYPANLTSTSRRLYPAPDSRRNSSGSRVDVTMALSMMPSTNPFSENDGSAPRQLYSSMTPERTSYTSSASFDVRRPPSALLAGLAASSRNTNDAGSSTFIVDNGGIGAFPTRTDPRDSI